jgi:hypothetical protein
MRVLAIAFVAAIVGGSIGWKVGDSAVPSGGELETAIYPVLGTGIGVLIALAIVLAVVKAARSSRGRNDL